MIYSISALSKLAAALRENHYDGLANTVYWWRNIQVKSDSYRVMRRPLKDMPMFMTDEVEWVRIIAVERLRIGV